MADLAERGEVQGVVEVAVPAPRQPVSATPARRVFDGGGAVVGGVGVSVREPGDVAGVADQHRGDDRPDPEHVSQRRVGGGDGGSDPAMGLFELGVEVFDVGQQLCREIEPDLFNRRPWFDAVRGSRGRQKR